MSRKKLSLLAVALRVVCLLSFAASGNAGFAQVAGPDLNSVLVVPASSGASPAAFAGGVSLGTAGPANYTILSLGGQASNSDGITKTDVTLNNQTSVQGNVGVAATGNISTTGNAFINGTLFLNTSGTWSHSGTSGASSFSQSAATDAKLNQSVQDALNASQQAAAQPSTQPSITSITLGDHGTETIHGTGQDVLNLTTFDLGNNSVLTLDAPAGSSFVLNISGNFTNQGRVILTGGLSPNDVLYNVTGTGQAIQFSGGGNSAQLNGILLSPFRDIQLAPGLVVGEIIGGGNILTLTSGADAVPEPSTVALVVLVAITWAGAAALRRRRSTQTNDVA
jgi:hypothetical protein